MSPAWYSASDFLQAAAQERARLGKELERLRALRREHEGRRAEVERRRDETGGALAAALLPTLGPAELQQAVKLTGAVWLVGDDVIAAREAERTALLARRAEIEADPRWRDRDRLRAPRVGTQVREIAELEDFRGPMAQIVTLADHERLARLIETHYGTDEYKVPFWRMSYYSDWKAGDEILARFPEKKHFGEVRVEYLNASATLAVLDAKLVTLRAEVAAGEALAAEHAQRDRTLAALDGEYLAKTRQRLLAHLGDCDMASLADRLGAVPDLALLFKSYRGLAAKAEYLAGLDQQVLAEDGVLQEQLEKLRRDTIKWSRPKKQWERIAPDAFEKRFMTRTDRWQKRRDRLARMHDSVWQFDRYDRVSFVEQFLWWDVMTDGKFDGDFLPEVHEFRQQHPDYSFHGSRERAELDDGAAAAAAAIADTSSDDDRQSGGAFDPS